MKAIESRRSERIKQSKILFDSSKAAKTKRDKQTAPTLKTSLTKRNVCCICKKHEKNMPKLIHCKGKCTTRIHLTCLQSVCEHFAKDEELSWKCSDCQSCRVCNGGADDTPILKCYICLSYFHLNCHGLEDQVKVVRENRFRCQYCTVEKYRKTTADNSTIGCVTRNTRSYTQYRIEPANLQNKFLNAKKSVSFHRNDLTVNESNELKNLKRRRCCSMYFANEDRKSISGEIPIPDVGEWSIDDVYIHFRKKFPDSAHVFKDQEINGKSLRQLRRDDILRYFEVKLGPALNLWQDVEKLQKTSRMKI